MDIQQFEGRKQDHLRHALNPDHQATGLSGFSRIHLHHEAIPDLNFEDIDLATACFGARTKTPFYVAGMTAGHSNANAINRILALACDQRGWAMGVGSQRRDLEAKQVDRWHRIRDEAPDLVLFANLGISQLDQTASSELMRLVTNLDAKALVVHTNPLQEVLQPEGTPQFSGSLEALRRVCRDFKSEGIPVALKETGCGFSKTTLKRLAPLGLAAIDISGLGGTHWGRIEGTRAAKTAGKQHLAAAASTFANWGESTVDSLLAAKEVLTEKVEIWGSGGVRSGLDGAKLIALGARRVGYAQPALEAALAGSKPLLRWMELQEYELRVALFCTGCKTPSHLRKKEES
ncbi:MAG: type 2 isopentenyl-diphosphate Delta-isomerase, partial [Bdellovibrionales bacterium GWC1_52_8]